MSDCDYEPIEHTADLGLRIHGRDLAEVFLNAGRGMLSLCVDPATIRPGRERRVNVTGDDTVEVLFEWLREILYQFNVSAVIWQPERITGVTDCCLEAVVREDPIDATRHELRHEVKAATYHGLTIEQTDDGWTAEAIFDV